MKNKIKKLSLTLLALVILFISVRIISSELENRKRESLPASFENSVFDDESLEKFKGGEIVEGA